MILRRILTAALPAYEQAGWRPCVGVYMPSLDDFDVMVEWEGEGEPVEPVVERG